MFIAFCTLIELSRGVEARRQADVEAIQEAKRKIEIDR